MAFQPIFLRHDTFIAVLPIKLTSKITIAVGEEVSLQQYPTHRLLSWHRKRYIGKKGCDWVTEKLAKYSEKSGEKKPANIEENREFVNFGVELPEPKKKKRKKKNKTSENEKS